MKIFIKYTFIAILFFVIGYNANTVFITVLKDDTLPFSKLQEIKDKKQLNAIVMNSPTVYYYGNDENTGFEYELLKAYTNDIGVNGG